MSIIKITTINTIPYFKAIGNNIEFNRVIGNIFIDNNGQIIPVDFGIMGILDKLNKRFLAEILFGLIQRDYKKDTAKARYQ